MTTLVGHTVADVNAFYTVEMKIIEIAMKNIDEINNKKVTKIKDELFNAALDLKIELLNSVDNSTGFVNDDLGGQFATAMAALKKEASRYISRKELSNEPEPSTQEKVLRVITWVAVAILFLFGIAAIGLGVTSILAAPGVGLAPGAFLTVLGMNALGSGAAIINIGAGAIVAGLTAGICGGALLWSLRRPDEAINRLASEDHHLDLQIDRIGEKIPILFQIKNIGLKKDSKQYEDSKQYKEWQKLSEEFKKAYEAATDRGEVICLISHNFIERLNKLEDEIDQATKLARAAKLSPQTVADSSDDEENPEESKGRASQFGGLGSVRNILMWIKP